MTATIRHELVNAAVLASTVVVEKAASANQDQMEIIEAVLPGDEPTTKMASLARLLATAQLVDEPLEV